MSDIEKQRWPEEGLPVPADEIRRSSDANTLTVATPVGSQKEGKTFNDDSPHGSTANAKENDANDDDERYLVAFTQGDPTNPLNFTQARKWMIVGVCCAAAFNVTCASSMAASAFGGISEAFGVGREVAILSISLFVAGLGLGPSLLGPLSEFFGRRIVYLISFGAFVLLGFPVAFANNIAVFLIFRFLTGFAGSGFLSISGGTVSDLFEAHEIFLPMAIYTCSPFIGPVAGPLISGFINENIDWRWTFRILLIWSGFTFVLLYFAAPETFAPIILCQTARKYRTEKKDGSDRWYAKHERVVAGKSISQSILGNCSKVYKLLSLEPMLLALCIWSALLLGVLYLCFEAFPIIFAKHDFSLQETGLSFLGIGLGMILGMLSMPYWAKKYAAARKAALEQGLKAAPPEARLPVGMAGAILTVVGLFWLAFTTYKSVHWIVPIIASIPFGAGTVLAYVAIFTFTVDAYRPVAASAMSANSIVRSCFAAAFPLFATFLYEDLGTVGATALLAGLATLMIPIPILFYRYGPVLRARGRFAA
ncbi:unnamed protein product [Tilletia controversa]|uniref:Major facilitator superfamily (MFS) profile domain-containing protein n=3 Tax=Tilletia TaxID=13289 RepID=A0A8X7MNN3_9BASI|nr:hypothetical protein CF336_g6616 [Tilletia laevis]KAE8189411.1 hypothetical protein CF328_g6293 [Tilletia controversa]KAE8253540.1 hypothetical protein A4X03_0g5871 [Tilletia caries]KAE8191906.1 hypothetical protein CF335_g5967 [Tilletia laevis]KAE8242163.1 hypothetical protein A4X06_0g7174 [Tilletia controversa]